MSSNSDKYEYFRFPLLPTLLSGVFLIIVLRIYWEPLFYLWHSQSGEESFLQHFSKWGPIWKYGFERLRLGEIPHWDPYQLCGHPYLIDPRIGLFQPLNLFFYLLDFADAYQMTIILGTFLLGISFIIWGRMWGVNFLALVPGAVALMFSGFTVWAQLSLTFLNGCVWLSLLINGVLMFLESRSLRNLVVILMLWCMLILSGSFECILTGALLMIALPFLLARIFSPPEKKFFASSIFLIVLVMILGIGITAFSWLPSFIWVLSEGNRDILGLFSLMSTPTGTIFPSSLKEMFYQLVNPLITTEFHTIPIFYLGLIPLTVVIPAFFDREGRKPAFFLLMIIGLCICFYYIDLRIAHSLRVGTSIVLVQSCLLLFSIGYNRTFLKGSDITSPYIWGSVLILLVSSIVMIFLGNVWAKGILILFLFTMMIFSLVRFNWIKVLGCILSSLLIFLELFYPLRQLMPVSYAYTIRGIETKSKAIKEVKNFTAMGRTYIQNIDEQGILWSSNIGMYSKWQLMNGDWEFTPPRCKLWLQSIESSEDASNLNLPLLTASGVRWICSERRKGDEIFPSREGWRSIEKFPNIILKENSQSLMRAFIVSNLIKEDNFENILKKILNMEANLSSECFVEEAPPDVEKMESPYESAVNIEELSPEHIIVNISTPKNCFLVLLDSYSSGWNVKLDQIPTKLYRVNGIFRGTTVPAGKHKVEFFYTTPGWREGWIISIIGVAVFIILSIPLNKNLKG